MTWPKGSEKLEIQPEKYYKKKIRGYVNDKNIRVNQHFLRFKVISVNGTMAHVLLPNGTTQYIKIEDFEEDFDFPLKYRIAKSGKIYHHHYVPKEKKMRSGSFTLKVVIPSGNDEFWEEVLHPKGINESLVVEEVKRIFEEHGFDDVDVEVQSIRFDRT